MIKLTGRVGIITLLVFLNSIVTFAQQPATAKKTCLSGNCSNGKGKVVYPNGDTYEGDFVNNIPDGFGTFTEINGNVYAGQMSKSEFQGKGKFFWKSGSVYEGDFVKNKREGEGKTTSADGSYFAGIYKGDWREGFGIEYDKSKNELRKGVWTGSTLVTSTSVSSPEISSTSTAQNGNASPQYKNSGAIAKLMEEYKADALKVGHSVVASGIYNDIETLEFPVIRGKTYLIIAIAEGKAPFGIDLFSYPDQEFLKPTHDWYAKNYKYEQTAEYSMKTKLFTKDTHSVLYLNFQPTPLSRIDKIRFFPNKNKGLPIYWVILKLK